MKGDRVKGSLALVEQKEKSVREREGKKEGNEGRKAHGPCIERSNHYVVKVGLCP